MLQKLVKLKSRDWTYVSALVRWQSKVIVHMRAYLDLAAACHLETDPMPVIINKI
jgi:hypothetical protein